MLIHHITLAWSTLENAPILQVTLALSTFIWNILEDAPLLQVTLVLSMSGWCTLEDALITHVPLALSTLNQVPVSFSTALPGVPQTPSALARVQGSEEEVIRLHSLCAQPGPVPHGTQRLCRVPGRSLGAVRVSDGRLVDQFATRGIMPWTFLD